MIILNEEGIWFTMIILNEEGIWLYWDDWTGKAALIIAARAVWRMNRLTNLTEMDFPEWCSITATAGQEGSAV